MTTLLTLVGIVLISTISGALLVYGLNPKKK